MTCSSPRAQKGLEVGGVLLAYLDLLASSGRIWPVSGPERPERPERPDFGPLAPNLFWSRGRRLAISAIAGVRSNSEHLFDLVEDRKGKEA